MTTWWLQDDFRMTSGSEHSEITQKALRDKRAHREQVSNQTSSYRRSLKYFVLLTKGGRTVIQYAKNGNMLTAFFSRMERSELCAIDLRICYSRLSTLCWTLNRITVPSLNIPKYGCWYFLIIFIVNCGMTCSCCPGQVLTKISVRASGHHTGQRLQLHPSYSSISKTFHFHNKTLSNMYFSRSLVSDDWILFVMSASSQGHYWWRQSLSQCSVIHILWAGGRWYSPSRG